jgi:hypothetical protein
MVIECRLVPSLGADEGGHPDRLRVELVLIEYLEIGRLDLPKHDILGSIHCFCRTFESVWRNFGPLIDAPE